MIRIFGAVLKDYLYHERMKWTLATDGDKGVDIFRTEQFRAKAGCHDA